MPDADDFTVTIKNSKIENSYEAGYEVAKKIMDEHGKKPDFVLLFATSHYNYFGGYKELLRGVWDILPDKTLLIGGEIAGFMNHEDVFAKGVTCLALSNPNMNVSYGTGENIKRNPTGAARKCANMIKKNLSNKFENKILITLATPANEMNIPGIENVMNFESTALANLLLPLSSIAQKVFQKGLGTDQEVIEEFSNFFPDFGLINIAMINSQTLAMNHQFLNKKVLRETFIAIAIESNLNYHLSYENASILTDKKFKITKLTKDKHIIKEINHKPAFTELKKIMDWSPDNELIEDRWFITTFKNPLAYEYKDKIHLRCIGMKMGEYIGFMNKVENTEITMATMSRNKMVEVVDDILNIEKPKFGFFASCVVRQAFLGIKAFEVHQKIKNYFKNEPFLLVYSGGESIKHPNQDPEYLNLSITSAIFGDN